MTRLTINGVPVIEAGSIRFDAPPAAPPLGVYSASATMTVRGPSARRLRRALRRAFPKRRNRLFTGRAGEAFLRRRCMRIMQETARSILDQPVPPQPSITCADCKRSAQCIMVGDSTMYRPTGWIYPDPMTPFVGLCRMCQRLQSETPHPKTP